MVSTTLSAWSIFTAFVGVTINAIVTKPYTKVSYLISSDKIKRAKHKERFGVFANFLIIIGTLGQLVSLFIRF